MTERLNCTTERFQRVHRWDDQRSGQAVHGPYRKEQLEAAFMGAALCVVLVIVGTAAAWALGAFGT